MTVTVYCDGGSRNHHEGGRHNGYARFQIEEDGRLRDWVHKELGAVTSPEAEYEAITRALIRLTEMCKPEETKVKLFMDSELILGQVFHGMNVRATNLVTYWVQAKKLVGLFKKVTPVQITGIEMKKVLGC